VLQDDPTSCSFFKWEVEYKQFLCRNGLVEGHGVQCDEVLGKEQMLQMKHEIEQLTCEIMHLRQHLGKKLAVVESVCLIGVLVVGCVIGVLVAMLCK